jgi:hypothetical protein
MEGGPFLDGNPRRRPVDRVAAHDENGDPSGTEQRPCGHDEQGRGDDDQERRVEQAA